MYLIEFSREYKERVFDKIAECYFERNFGSMGKADFETLLFSEYVEYLIDNGYGFDDYSLSKQLGITQSRIRSLKERKELKYPVANNNYWKQSFANAIKNAKYEEESKRIKIHISDVNVLIEIRHQIEKIGWYDDYQLNPRLLTIRLDCFLELCASVNDNDNIFSSDVRDRINKLASEEGFEKDVKGLISDFTVKSLGGFALNVSTELICEVLKLMPFGGIAGECVKGLVRIMKRE